VNHIRLNQFERSLTHLAGAAFTLTEVTLVAMPLYSLRNRSRVTESIQAKSVESNRSLAADWDMSILNDSMLRVLVEGLVNAYV
jgi:hypothetical protein